MRLRSVGFAAWAATVLSDSMLVKLFVVVERLLAVSAVEVEARPASSDSVDLSILHRSC